MYKMQTRKIYTMNISKYISLFLLLWVVFFWNFILWQSLSFWLDIWTKLSNFENNWQNKNTMRKWQWDAVIKDLFENNLKQVESSRILPITDAVDKVSKQINWLYSCNLMPEDVFNILYNENLEFRMSVNKLKNKQWNWPDNEAIFQSCNKFNVCRYKDEDKDSEFFLSVDIMNTCMVMVNDVYTVFMDNNKNQLTLKDMNYWKELFWNNDLDDSSYDLLYDIDVISKLLFDSPKTPSTTNFYRFPSWGAGMRGGDSNGTNKEENQAIPTNGFSDVYNWFGPEQGNGLEADNNDSGNNTDLDDNNVDNNSNLWNNWNNLVWLDPDGTWLIWWNASNNWRNICYDGTGLSWGWDDTLIDSSEWNLLDEETGGLTWDEELTINEHIDNILAQEENLSCNKNGVCDGFETESCSDCDEDSEDLKDIKSAVASAENFWDLEDLDNLKSCLLSCNSWTIENKMACIAKCSCDTIESPLYDSDTFPWYSSMFKIRYCMVPPKNSSFSNQTTVQSIEEILQNIEWVMKTLKNSGMLTPKNITREYMDQSNQKYSDMWGQSAFLMNAMERSNYSNEDIKVLEEKQRNLHSIVMSNILWAQNDIQDPRELNKYIIVGNPSLDKMSLEEVLSLDQAATIMQKSNYITNIQNNTANLDNYFDNELVVVKNNQIIDFASYNSTFWNNTYNTMLNVLKTSNALLDKKNN